MSEKPWMRNRAGGPLHRQDLSCGGMECWPVAVIDTEDREQVERLSGNYVLAHSEGMVPIDALLFALREFANPTPPKPKEPLGLGAVVEAINGNYFVRVGAAGWVHFDDPSGEPCDWRDIAAVRVLSEGVKEGDR